MPHAEPALDESFESNWMESTAAAALFEQYEPLTTAELVPVEDACENLYPSF